jgi:hypothetical protein
MQEHTGMKKRGESRNKNVRKQQSRHITPKTDKSTKQALNVKRIGL